MRSHSLDKHSHNYISMSEICYHHVDSVLMLHRVSKQKSLVPYLEQRHKMGHVNSLLAQFPIWGCAYLSLSLE